VQSISPINTNFSGGGKVSAPVVVMALLQLTVPRALPFFPHPLDFTSELSDKILLYLMHVCMDIMEEPVLKRKGLSAL
jgi:hypothetical protein